MMRILKPHPNFGRLSAPSTEGEVQSQAGDKRVPWRLGFEVAQDGLQSGAAEFPVVSVTPAPILLLDVHDFPALEMLRWSLGGGLLRVAAFPTLLIAF